MQVQKRKRNGGVSKQWYAQADLADGRGRRWVKLTTDKRKSESLLAELLAQAERRKRGLVEPCETSYGKPIGEHVDDFERHLRENRSGGNSAKYVKERLACIRGVLAACGFRTIAEIDAGRVQSVLAEMREHGGWSARAYNEHLSVCKQFTKWLVDYHRAVRNPLTALKLANVRAEPPRRKRRAASPAEIAGLIDATAAEPTRHGLTGRARSMLYWFAAATGFRARECGSVTWADLKLDGDNPTATVRAGYSKRRRDDTQPLPADLAAALAAWRLKRGRESDGMPLWKLPDRGPTTAPGTALMLRDDLVAAGVAYETGDGVLDFHALRHTYVTMVVNSGAQPQEAQKLARHSTVTLTMDRYYHGDAARSRQIVAKLPKLGGKVAG